MRNIPQWSLADDEIVHLRDACGSRVEVTEGHLWITIEGDHADIVLGRGESYLVQSDDVVTASALRGAAAARVRAAVGATACATTSPTALTQRPGRVEQALARLALSSVAVA